MQNIHRTLITCLALVLLYKLEAFAKRHFAVLTVLHRNTMCDQQHCAVQVLIVQYGGKWFQTVPLHGEQWAACTGIGAVSLLVRAGLRLIPTNKK